MICAWSEFLAIVPPQMREEVDRLGKNNLQELRLRLHKQPQLVTARGSLWLNLSVTQQDLNFVVNTASRYSPWSASTAANGYITAQGGHRVGLCGEVAACDGAVQGIRTPVSVCIRVARDFPGIAANAAAARGNILILGPPGSGKTTLLRDLIRQLSQTEMIAVVDERGELFPMTQSGHCFETGKCTDIIFGCGKAPGVDMVLRTMGPTCIAVDEITASEDCRSLVEAGWCGVRLLATAHAVGPSDLCKRPVYRPLRESGLFDTLLILKPDKSWHTERMII